MSTQQDIYAACFENRPAMLNKENYVSWSSRLLRYAKSRLNRKLIYNSIINGPYVRRIIPEPRDQNREVLENWLRVQQMMKGSDIGIQEKKAKNQVIHNAVQNPGIQNVRNQNGLIVVSRIANQNPNRNGNVVAARAEGIGNGNNVNLDEIYDVNANCILMANLQRASTSVLTKLPPMTQTDQLCVEQDRGTVDQHPATVEETHAYFESLYNNLAIEVEKVNSVSEQKDITKGMSVNTQFCKQSILGKPPSSSGSKHYAITHFTKSKGLSKIDETHTLSKPITSNSVPTPQESKVMKNDNVIAPGMFRINPFKPSKEEKYVPNKVRASIRINPITVSQPHVITKRCQF
uniref:Ribonuclease H-like domain-containing protein n=1 Tax=Tanacetum cinerariifolium TaxID=118510 RepID=A0A699HV99_TANCI|nr:ribonuclease H-like domain-containing protein [Tanacetum cinerariifolium]